ncbi:MAG: killer suppression protein [Magnetococcales bacterium]|nr:killer suppression protein [Magnetococcales bacterium]
MEIFFRDRKLKKECNSQQSLQKAYGEKQARLIALRLKAIRAAVHLGEFWPTQKHTGRCHELKGNRAGQLSMDLDHPYRLIFEPANVPIEQRPEGGLDWHRVTAILIIGVEDTHE